MQPTSVQCGTPLGAPLYPVVRMRRSRVNTQPTAARGHVERVATVRAICMKYSSQPGRIYRLFHHRWNGARRAEHPVSRIAQSWDDVAVIVEPAVECRRHDPAVRLRAHHFFNTFRRSDDADERHVGTAARCKRSQCCGTGVTGRQHWIEYEDLASGQIVGEIRVVRNRGERLRIAIESE